MSAYVWGEGGESVSMSMGLITLYFMIAKACRQRGYFKHYRKRAITHTHNPIPASTSLLAGWLSPEHWQLVPLPLPLL